MKTSELVIEGMTCGHCVMAVKKELEKITGLKVNDVQKGSAKIEYEEDTVTPAVLKNAIEEAGFDLIEEKQID